MTRANRFVEQLNSSIASAVLLCAAAVFGAGAHDSRAQTPAAGFTPGSFSVNPSGAATYTIPIQVPPGIDGMEPKLALTYNSQVGNGQLGMGWSISGFSSVQRCPQTLAQDGVRGGMNYDANDRFCLDGQRLMSIGTAVDCWGGTEYRTELESFSKVISCGTAGSGPAYFKVWTKAGQIMEYGNSVDINDSTHVRIEAVPASASILWPAGTVRVWALNKVSDRKGNYLTVSYTEDSANGDFYPAQINYTGNTATGTATSASVQFVLETTPRPDVVFAYVAGSIVKTVKRFQYIRTYAGNNLVREYRLVYSNSGANARSKLTSVQECDGSRVACLTAITLQWQPGADGSFTQATNFNLTNTLIAHSNGTVGSLLGDFNGDGKTDILRVWDDPSNNALFLSNGDGTFTQATNFNLTNTLIAHSNSTVGSLLGDFNGDGKIDILRRWDDPINNALFLSNGDGTFTQATNFNLTNTLIAHSNGTVGSFTDDFNGDGKMDILRRWDDPNNNALFLSNGDGTFTQVPNFNLTNTLIAHSNSTVGAFTGDFNGDGKADILRRWDDPNNTALFQAAPIIPVPPIQDLLSQITDGLGAVTSIAYRALTDSTAYAKDADAPSNLCPNPNPPSSTPGTANLNCYPYQNIQNATYVVSSASSSNGVGGTLTTTYQYGGLKSDLSGRGLLGFRTLDVTNPDTTFTHSEYRQDWPFTGMSSLAQRKVPSGGGPGGLVSSSSSSFGCTNPATGSTCTIAAGNRYFPFVSQSVSSGYDLNGAVLPTVSTTTVYDAYGNPTSILASTGDGYSKTTANTYAAPDTANWFLGRLIRSTVTSVTP